MVSIAACHAVDRSSILLGTAKVCWVRLSVRTLAFHVSKTGSIPVPVPYQCNGGRATQGNGLQIRKTAGLNPARCSNFLKGDLS